MASLPDYKYIARTIFLAAVEAVHPYALIRNNILIADGYLTVAGQSISLSDINHLYVIGAGKATAAMAKAVEDILGNLISGGVILVKYDHTVPLRYISTVEAAHPVPDRNGVEGTIQLLELVNKATANDLVIALISGGGSALVIDLPSGCTLEELQSCFDVLLRCGASIEEINTVRKHLSGVKGGQLAKAVYPARLMSLILSDVIGDPLDVIASGPTVADPTTFTDAWYVMKKYDILNRISSNIRLHLEQGLQGMIPDTPKPADSIFQHMYTHIIGSNAIALEVARKKVETLGLYTKILRADISGNAEEVAIQLVEQARSLISDPAIPKPACILAGGETTVTVTGKGKGGRNQHLVLAAAIQLKPEDTIIILSAGTDGTDGPTDAAGAVVDSLTVGNALMMGIRAEDYLINNDSYHFFKQAGGHIITGPTMTNVMDIMLAIVY